MLTPKTKNIYQTLTILAIVYFPIKYAFSLVIMLFFYILLGLALINLTLMFIDKFIKK